MPLKTVNIYVLCKTAFSLLVAKAKILPSSLPPGKRHLLAPLADDHSAPTQQIAADSAAAKQSVHEKIPQNIADAPDTDVPGMASANSTPQ